MRSHTLPVIHRTARACSNTARISPSSARSLGSSAKPIALAIGGCSSSGRTSARLPVSRWSALRTLVRNSSASSSAVRSCGRSRPAPSRRDAADGFEPPQRLQVAEAAGARFQIGLQHGGGWAHALVACSGVGTQHLGEPSGVVRRDRPHRRARSIGELPVPRQVPQVEHRGEPVEALTGSHDALLGGAHRVPHLEPGVPQRIEQAFDQGRDLIEPVALMQHQQVHVGTRQLLAPAVATDRGERDARRGSRRLEQFPERGVEQIASPGRRPEAVVALGVGTIEGVQLSAQTGDRFGGVHGRLDGAILRRRRDPSRRCGSG